MSVSINVDVKYQTEKGFWLCFMHAVKRASQGDHITTIAEDFSSEYDMRDTCCRDCRSICDEPQVDNPYLPPYSLFPLSAHLRRALHDIVRERNRQDAKWGQQNHDPQFWTGILVEEVGELSQAINETVFNNGPEERAKGGYDNMRKEAVQVAAVAVAFVELLDRRYGGEYNDAVI